MNKIKITQIFSLFLALLFLGACKKEAESIFTMFDGLEVSFENKSEYAIVEDAVVNDGDSVHIYFTVTSKNEDMLAVVIDSTNGTGTWSTREIPTTEDERRSYSGVVKFKMQRDGEMTFRFYALNRINEYLGDGYTSITVKGATSYRHIANRRLYAPTEDGEDFASFMSLTTGEVFTYKEAQQASSKVDFGIDTLFDTRANNSTELVYNLYSPSVQEYPVPYYDLSGWEKRETLFSEPQYNVSNTFYTRTLVSASKIEEEALKVSIDQNQTYGLTSLQGLAPGTLLYFLTPEGKYGALYVAQSTTNTKGRPYINVNVKITN